MKTEGLPYLEQSFSWKEGMRYRYCPDLYPLTKKQIKSLNDCGALVGEYLETKGSNSILEFRIDYVVDWSGNLFLTEVQTDDRGLPAVAIARNATGKDSKNLFPGVIETFAKALQNKTGKTKPLLLITFPDEERFYYTGFEDVATLCFGTQIGPEIIISPRSSLRNVGDILSVRFWKEGLNLNITPDLVWNFSDQELSGFETIQTPVNKQILLDIWGGSSRLSKQLQTFVPQTVPINSEIVSSSDKDNWILKPINGRWSRGVVIGEKIDINSWSLTVNNGFRNNLVAQKYIRPRSEYFNVYSNNGDCNRERMFARLEGYYVKVYSEWILADTLATCTKDVPVHGKRDCIMINGGII